MALRCAQVGVVRRPVVHITVCAAQYRLSNTLYDKVFSIPPGGTYLSLTARYCTLTENLPILVCSGWLLFKVQSF